jgi:hypothetical protein
MKNRRSARNYWAPGWSTAYKRGWRDHPLCNIKGTFGRPADAIAEVTCANGNETATATFQTTDKEGERTYSHPVGLRLLVLDKQEEDGRSRRGYGLELFSGCTLDLSSSRARRQRRRRQARLVPSLAAGPRGVNQYETPGGRVYRKRERPCGIPSCDTDRGFNATERIRPMAGGERLA